MFVMGNRSARWFIALLCVCAGCLRTSSSQMVGPGSGAGIVVQGNPIGSVAAEFVVEELSADYRMTGELRLRNDGKIPCQFRLFGEMCGHVAMVREDKTFVPGRLTADFIVDEVELLPGVQRVLPFESDLGYFFRVPRERVALYFIYDLRLLRYLQEKPRDPIVPWSGGGLIIPPWPTSISDLSLRRGTAPLSDACLRLDERLRSQF